MKSISTKSDSSQPAADTAVYLFDDWFDPIEAGVRNRRASLEGRCEGSGTMSGPGAARMTTLGDPGM